MELTARLNGPPQLTGTALIVLCGYRGGCDNRAPRSAASGPAGALVGGLIDRATLLGLRRFIAIHRDHFANPRDLAYELGLAEAVCVRARFESFELLVDRALVGTGPAPALAGAASVRVDTVSAAALGARGRYETIVLVYPDALGLSWSQLEARALAIAARVVVATGRRRLFTLDRPVRRALRWRRFLAATRLAELGLTAAAVPLAAMLAASDRLSGRG